VRVVGIKVSGGNADILSSPPPWGKGGSLSLDIQQAVLAATNLLVELKYKRPDLRTTTGV
jgi:hypothetical protein